jgi:PAS domain S-box-containing protein
MIVIAIVVAFFVFYYPARQQELIRQYQTNEILQVSTSIALGITQSLNEDNFKQLEEIMDFAEATSDFDFVDIVLVDKELGDTISFIKPKTFDKAQINSDAFDTEKSLIDAENFRGDVTVGVGRARIKEKVSNLNNPIYSLLFSLLACITLILYLIVKRITLPVQELTEYASSLTFQHKAYKTKFSRFIAKEIYSLKDSLVNLSQNLAEQKELNDKLMVSLEEKVKQRTNELLVTTSQLENAQKIAKISAFRFFSSTNKMEIQSNFYEMTELPANDTFTLERFLFNIEEVDRKKFASFLQNHETLNSRREIDFCLKPQNDKLKKNMYCVGEFNIDETNGEIVFNGVLQDLSEIKQKQQEIERLSLVAKNTSNAVIITDLKKRILWVNESTERITGYSSEELIGQTPRIFQFEKTDQEKIRRINKSLDEHIEVQEELLNRSKNGEEYWVSINIVSLKDDKGVPFGYMAIENDITQTKFLQVQREQYVQMLEESRTQIRKMNSELEQKVQEKTKDIQRLALFPQQNPNPVIEIDLLEQKLLYQNPSSIRIFGELTDFSYSQINELLSLESINLSEIRTADEIQVNQFTFERNLYVLENKILRIYLHDITDRKKNENALVKLIEQLQKTEQELTEKKSALEHSILELERTQQEIINKERLTVLGVLIAGIAHEINNPLGAIRAAGENLVTLLNDLFYNEIKDFSIEEINTCSEFVRELNVKSQTTMEQHQNAKEVETALEKQGIYHKNIKSISRRLAQMGIVEIDDRTFNLMNRENSQELVTLCQRMYNIKNSAIIIKKAAEQGSKVVRALNSFSHGTDGNQKTTFDLQENIETVIIILWSKIKQNSKIHNRIPANTRLFGYEDEMTQVWTNIIINALQASNYSCEIFADYQVIDQKHQIKISNDGPEIPHEVMDKLFDPFFTTKIKGEGTGLGLNIVKQIIEKHHGSIRVESSPALTSFIIEFPFEQPNIQ